MALGLLWLYYAFTLTPGHLDVVEGGIFEVFTGVAALAIGFLVYLRPKHHVIEGSSIVVSAISSLFFAFVGGFFIGFLLALIGGGLAILWKPRKQGDQSSAVNGIR